ncbi:penicillin-binding protein activator [Fodinicurvata sp. EGI_FJ10296]|uniref:penicillin-binding protein activator n=1 Tax=Fodinicurvata sp. EGI_FJ10296 TaxID=3231908 RepID=UPI003452E63B
MTSTIGLKSLDSIRPTPWRWSNSLMRSLQTLGLAVVTVVVAACGPTIQSGPPMSDQPVEQPRERTDRFGRVIDDEKILVGLLLPLSGRAEELGQSMLNAAQMAMFDAADDRFELVPVDTGGSAAGAARAAQDVVNQGVDLILGPLTGEEVAEVGPVARSAGINVVAYTTDAERADSNVFVMGLLPELQVDRVVAHSVENGLSRFAVIAPGSRYGRLIAQSLNDAANRRGGTLATTAYYGSDGSDVADRVAEVVNADPDAIMIPAAGQALESIASLILEAAGPTQMLGTGLWDDSAIGRIEAVHGGWFAAPNPNLRRDFENRYQQTFGSAPERLATLAYDSVAMAAILARQPQGNPFGRQSLTDPGGFAGLDGIFRFQNNGLIDRGLAVLEVTPNGPRLRQDAPTTFLSEMF